MFLDYSRLGLLLRQKMPHRYFERLDSLSRKWRSLPPALRPGWEQNESDLPFNVELCSDELSISDLLRLRYSFLDP